MKTIVPEGYQETKLGLVPKDWNIVKLREIATKCTKKNTDESITTVFSNSALNGIVLQSEYFDKDIAQQGNLDGYYIVESGDFVYNPRISSNAPAGPINRNLHNQTGVVSPLYTVFGPKSNEQIKFLEYFFKSTKWLKYMMAIANYGARHDRMNVTSDDFFDMPIPMPENQERQKIAEILTTCDEVIIKQEELIKEKEQLKKGLMQKLLSGEVRFDGYKEKWTKCKLKDLVFFQEGPGVRNTQYTKTGVKLLNVGNINNNQLNLDATDKYISDEQAYGQYKHFLVDEGDLLISCSGINAESFKSKIAFVKSEHLPLCMNTSTMRFKSTSEKLLLPYLYYFFQTHDFEKQVFRVLSGSAQFNFGPTHIKWFTLNLPTIKEQQKIIDILDLNDKEIKLLKNELEELKLQKKALMQKLLTGEVRVKV